MSFRNDRTRELWKNFMPCVPLQENGTRPLLYSVNLYPAIPGPDFFYSDTPYIKWASIEVLPSWTVPDDFKELVLPGGLYAVFLHRGATATAEKTFRYIYMSWLPGSGYELDDRPHFEVLGENYRNDDPGSEEEIWIPVRK